MNYYVEPDPLRGMQTKILLINPSNRQTVTVLDDFLSTHGERAINDPLKRAILQRDLWAIFDWSTQPQFSSPEKFSLQNKLALVIKRLPLSPEDIARLPNSYKQATKSKTFEPAYDSNKRDQPFLPPD